MTEVTLPSGARVRGRRLGAPATPVDLAVVLGAGPLPPWPARRVRWPDFGLPRDRADARAAFAEAHRLATSGVRVEVVCGGGRGRTGTALACIAQLAGVAPADAVCWVRERYDARAVETPWQRRYVLRFTA